MVIKLYSTWILTSLLYWKKSSIQFFGFLILFLLFQAAIVSFCCRSPNYTIEVGTI